MRTLRFMSMAAISLVCASVAFAAPLKLTPASPQPGGLKSGLSVSYAHATEDQDFTALADARSALKVNGKRGKPLRGLDYRDTNLGENSLTSSHSEQVAASITGYIRFDSPGIYTIDFFTNDGLLATIGGQQVGLFNGRQTCDTTFATEVEVPSAGWYKLSALYFNRLNTSCLMMRWAAKGDAMKWVPNNVFGRK